jgi:hypothetical protein
MRLHILINGQHPVSLDATLGHDETLPPTITPTNPERSQTTRTCTQPEQQHAISESRITTPLREIVNAILYQNWTSPMDVDT